jgi:hypothetical protein
MKFGILRLRTSYTALMLAQSSAAAENPNSAVSLIIDTSRSLICISGSLSALKLWWLSQTVAVILLPTVVNTELAALPTLDIPAMATRATSAATSAYSTISWPHSSCSRGNRFFCK